MRLCRMVIHDRTRNNFRCTRGGFSGGLPSPDALKSKVELPLYNMLLSTEEEEEAIALRDAIRAYVGNSFEVCRSWGIGIEIICPNDTKGMAALRLKDLLHAKLLVAAGDYENDISMIRAADIGYAVENATDEVKSAADRLTVDCKEHAIAAIIREIEESL
jgi:hydroxymethylpyrimidine pyrophosphatase-like HAD family hydrolase